MRGGSIEPSEFVSAVRNGLGRALVALQSNDVQPDFHTLRCLILRWPGYDAQCESTRGWYSAELLRASRFETEITDLLFRLMARTKGPWRHHSHRSALALQLADRGDERIKARTYELFNCDGEFRFARNIVVVDGLKGLDWILSHVDFEKYEDEWWQLRWWLEDAAEVDGEVAVEVWKQKAREAGGFIDQLLREAPSRFKERTESKRLTYAEMRNTWSRVSVLSWVVDADDAEIKLAWRALETETDPKWLRSLALGLQHRPDLCDLEPIISRARDWSGRPNYFTMALSRISNPRLRLFGLEMIAKGAVVAAMDVLQLNAQPGDESTIQDAVRPLTDEYELHSVGSDLLMFKGDLDMESLLTWVYENTPCSFCRNSAVHDLIKSKKAKSELLQECLLDCDPDTREVAEAALKELESGQP